MDDPSVSTPLATAAAHAPASLPTPPSNPRYVVGQRTLKMIAARCSVCQAEKNAPRDWWKRCTHDKYVTAQERPTTRPKYSDELDGEGQPTGRKILTGTETVVEWVPMPNWKEVALTPRINQGRGYQRNRGKGSIMPEELITEQWPSGGKPVCQYRGCFNTENLQEYSSGVFCSKVEAQLVWFDQEGKTFEYLNEADVDSLRKRHSQLEGTPV